MPSGLLSDFVLKCAASSRIHVEEMVLPAVLFMVHLCFCQGELGGAMGVSLRVGRDKDKELRNLCHQKGQAPSLTLGRTKCEYWL